MFIEGKHRQFWNLLNLPAYRRNDNGVLELFFQLGGGYIKIAPDHPQYRQIDRFLRENTIGPDQPH